jgi:transposase
MLSLWAASPREASRFCDLYAAWRGRLSPTMRQTHPAGERSFVGYAGQTVEVIVHGGDKTCYGSAGILLSAAK